MNIKRNCEGYVSLEFALAMGLLILPTILILLQIPTYLEQNNRLDSISAIISSQCAATAQSASNGNQIALEIANRERTINSTLKNVQISSARCIYQNIDLAPGSIVTAEIVAQLPAPVVPGADFGPRWQKVSTHSSVIPKYRSFD